MRSHYKPQGLNMHHSCMASWCWTQSTAGVFTRRIHFGIYKHSSLWSWGLYMHNNTQPWHARMFFSWGILNTLHCNEKRRLIIYYMYLLLTSFSAQNTSREKFANVAWASTTSCTDVSAHKVTFIWKVMYVYLQGACIRNHASLKGWTDLQLGSSEFALPFEYSPLQLYHKSFLPHPEHSATCGPGSLCQEIFAATWQTSPWVGQLALAHEQHHRGQRAWHRVPTQGRTTWVLQGALQSTLYLSGWAGRWVMWQPHLQWGREEDKRGEEVYVIYEILKENTVLFAYLLQWAVIREEILVFWSAIIVLASGASYYTSIND